MSIFRWRLKGDAGETVGEPASKLDDYALAAATAGIEILCPACEKWQPTRYTSKVDVMAAKDATNAEREQFLTGLCSDSCWRAYLGTGEPVTSGDTFAGCD